MYLRYIKSTKQNQQKVIQNKFNIENSRNDTVVNPVSDKGALAQIDSQNVTE